MIRFIIKILRLPLDLLLLTYHWMRGVLWMFGYAVKEAFDLPIIEQWPFHQFTAKTPSDVYVCTPAQGYANPFIFKLLCADLAYDPCNGCHCQMKMYEKFDRWKPSWLRLGCVGVGLLMVWSVPAYGVYRYLKVALPPDMKAAVRSVITRRPSATTNEAPVARAKAVDREKSQEFLRHADQLFASGKYTEAILDYSNAVQQDPENGAAYLGRGLCLLKVNRLPEALDAFEYATRFDRTLWKAHLYLGEYAAMADNTNEAIRHAQEILRTDETLPEGHLLLAECHRRQGQPQAARAEIDAVLGRGAPSVEISMQIAALFFRLDDFGRSEEFYRKALATDPDSVDARIGLSYLYSSQNQFPLARERLDQVLRHEPQNVRALVALAEWHVLKREIDAALAIYGRLAESGETNNEFALIRKAELLIGAGQPDEGAELLKGIVRTQPNHVKANLILARLYLTLKLYSSATAHANAVLDVARDNEQALSIAGRAYVGQERYDKAIAVLERLPLERVAEIDSLLLFGYALNAAGDTAKAIVVYQQAAKRFPQSPLPLLALGNIYRESGDHPGAMESYRAALRVDPEQLAAANNLAMMLLQQTNQIDEAYQVISVAQKKYPNHAAIADTLGWVLYHRGEYRAAKEALMRSLALQPDNPETLYHLGATCFALGDMTEAERNLNLALGRSSTFSGADKARELLHGLATKNGER